MSKRKIIELICDNIHCEKQKSYQIEPIIFGNNSLDDWIELKSGEIFCCSKCAMQYFEDKMAEDEIKEKRNEKAIKETKKKRQKLVKELLRKI